MRQFPVNGRADEAGNSFAIRKQVREIPGRSLAIAGRFGTLRGLGIATLWGSDDAGMTGARIFTVCSDHFPGQLMSLTRGGPMTYEPISLSPYEVSECPRQAGTGGAVPPPKEAVAYEPPMVIDLGHVREVTLGSSPSGSADANAQYYY
ncbi:lasso RiPP family leader peptide-containing protein [Streptomyces sp. NPDC046939]|uniref:lasso RiPP family leader peptide-containing protein n=1 Tax=Streptomyces sp. NPDC046939 TaxID=3155376 RepID=UPI0033C950B0